MPNQKTTEEKLKKQIKILKGIIENQDDEITSLKYKLLRANQEISKLRGVRFL